MKARMNGDNAQDHAIDTYTQVLALLRDLERIEETCTETAKERTEADRIKAAIESQRHF